MTKMSTTCAGFDFICCQGRCRAHSVRFAAAQAAGRLTRSKIKVNKSLGLPGLPSLYSFLPQDHKATYKHGSNTLVATAFYNIRTRRWISKRLRSRPTLDCPDLMPSDVEPINNSLSLGKPRWLLPPSRSTLSSEFWQFRCLVWYDTSDSRESCQPSLLRQSILSLPLLWFFLLLALAAVSTKVVVFTSPSRLGSNHGRVATQQLPMYDSKSIVWPLFCSCPEL